MARVADTEGMARVAHELIEGLVPGSRGARVIALSGDLGAGKTTLAQAIALELGVEEPVTSPTFVIERIYKLSPEAGRGFTHLIHIDAYRLHNAHEIEKLGWKDILSDPNNIILVEWPEHIESLIPEDARRVTLSYVDEAIRDISYDH